MLKNNYVLTEYENYLCREIADCAYQVHKELGPGLLEKIYEACLCHELRKRDIPFRRQAKLPFLYDGISFDEGMQVDIIVEDLIIVELKAVTTVNPVWEAQVISHLKLAGLHVGFLVNFNVVLIKDGIRRFSSA
ncbi:MAG: GxxExxY protein [Sphingobacteriales bacterium]|jgi:GxxExxY protein|nr:GxxExxY protein [Sphingobacteriales bacterium]OJW01249.1 MAG: GxxExxY protein [Sphingobacteriales bacterium 44-61]